MEMSAEQLQTLKDAQAASLNLATGLTEFIQAAQAPLPGGNPTAVITTPSNGAVLASGVISVGAQAVAAPGASITKVEFYVEDQKFASDYSLAYLALLRVTPGTRKLTVKAIDDKGHSTLSEAVTVTIT